MFTPPTEETGRELHEKTNALLVQRRRVALSSADLTGEVACCRELGVAARLTKPIRRCDCLTP